MNYLFIAIITVFLAFESRKCEFNGFEPENFGHGVGFGGNFHTYGRIDYRLPKLVQRLSFLEKIVERYLDRAITAAQTANSTNLAILQELRNTDLPSCINNIRQKLIAAQNISTIAVPAINGAVSGGVSLNVTAS